MRGISTILFCLSLLSGDQPHYIMIILYILVEVEILHTKMQRKVATLQETKKHP